MAKTLNEQDVGNKLVQIIHHFQILRDKAPLIVLDVMGHVAAAGDKGLPMRDLSRLTGRPQSTLSRVILELRAEYKGETGPGLVETVTDPQDYRMKIVKLTPKGHRLMKTLGETLSVH